MGWLPHTVSIPPAEEIITPAEARAQTRIDGIDEDGVLLGYIEACREQIETYCSTKLITQTVIMRARCFDDFERFRTAPLQSITAISYYDTSGNLQTLAPSVYEAVLLGLEPIVRLKYGQSWPAVWDVPDAIRVTAVAGYGDSEDVPGSIRQAALLTVASWAVDREIGELPDGAISLLTNYRV